MKINLNTSFSSVVLRIRYNALDLLETCIDMGVNWYCADNSLLDQKSKKNESKIEIRIEPTV